MITILGKRFNNRGVSVIIAALLLIAIAVAAAVLLYVFSIGLLGSLSGSGGSQTKDQLIMAAYNWSNTAQILLYLQNVGSSTLNLVPTAGASAPSYFVAGMLVKAQVGATNPCTTTQAPGTPACSMTLTNLPTVTQGAAYAIKVVTPDGGVFSYSAVAGQTG